MNIRINKQWDKEGKNNKKWEYFMELATKYENKKDNLPIYHQNRKSLHSYKGKIEYYVSKKEFSPHLVCLNEQNVNDK